VQGAIVKHKIFSAVQEHCPPEKPFAIRHPLLAAVLTFASRYSLPFPDLPICRFHDLPIRFGSAGASPSHDFRF
jgi:hypothetical protein